jgi:acyl-CoA thioesterase-1
VDQVTRRLPFLIVALLAAGAVHAAPLTIVAFGGSNTFGKGVSRADAYPAQLERLLQAGGIDAVVINAGTNGTTTGEEAAAVASAVPDGTRLVIYQPGSNDAGTGRKHSRSGNSDDNIRNVVQSLLDRHIPVLVTGSRDQRDAVGTLGVATIESIRQMALDDLQPDGQHLTPQGYGVVAARLLPAVKALLAPSAKP